MTRPGRLSTKHNRKVSRICARRCLAHSRFGDCLRAAIKEIHMIRTGLSVVAAAGLVIGGWAIAGENCHKGDAASHASAGGCGGKVQLSEAAIKALNENAAYKRADELLKSWSEVPAKFVAMSEE